MAENETEKFIAQTNIDNFRRRLYEASDETTRAVLIKLLRDEEAKLAALFAKPQGRSES